MQAASAYDVPVHTSADLEAEAKEDINIISRYVACTRALLCACVCVCASVLVNACAFV